MAKLYILFLLLCGLAHADQVNCVKWKNADGSTLGTYCKPFSIKAGPNVLFTDDPLGRIITIAASGGGSSIGGQYVVDGVVYTTIQAAVTAASTTGSVLIPSNYSGTDTYTNPNKIQILDLRGKANRQYGFVNALTACGLKGDGVNLFDDGAAINSCLQTWGQLGRTVLFPKTAATATGCDYYSTVPLVPYGSFEGEGSIWQNGTGLTGTNICFASGVTGINLQLVQCRGSCSGRNIGILSLDDFGQLSTTTKFIIPKASALTMYDRSNSSIQRASNVLTVTVKAVNGVGEKLFQQVGSTVQISSVSGDTSMNGLCIIATLSGGSFANDNYSTFTCPQNGADAGPFTNDGKVILPTTGLNISDGIRVCGNFYVFDHLSIQGFARWGINADANAGEGCDNAFADDLTVRESTITNNQVGGFFTRGTDSSVDLFIGNSFYYNGGMAIVDEGALGNTYIGNNISNNGAQWISGGTPATKNISSISRNLASNSSTVSVVLASADANIKVGSCVNIAGVTDASFRNTAGQCYFVTSVTDSTHYSYIQPGAPVDASSSGGTSRIGTWAEVYLSSGLDSGSFKMGLGASASSDNLLLNNYVEGGQPCKLATSVLYIQGTNGCSGSLVGSYISTQTFQAGGFGSNISHIGHKEQRTYELQFHAGLTTDQTEELTWMNHSNARAWQLQVSPTGTAGDTGSWILLRNTSVRRLIFTGLNNSSGLTRIGSEGTSAIELQKEPDSGTGGVEFWSGGAVPTKVASVDSAGLGTFNGGVKAGSSGSTIADSRELLQNVHLCGTTTTCANTANGSYRMIFGNVALSTGTALVGSITAFTSTSSFVCTGTDKTAVAAVQIVNTSTTSITINGTASDSIDYVCVGK